MQSDGTLIAMIILITTVVISLYAIYRNQSFYERFLLNPWDVVNEGRWYLLITSGFLHADMAHLLFNMLTFYFFAFTLASYVGTINFLIIYIGSLFLSNITTVIKNKNNPYYRAVGASGAISGILFSFILFEPGSRIYLYFAIGIPAPIFAALYLAYCYYASKRSQDLINHEAHLWGSLSGLILTAILYPNLISYYLDKIFG